MKVLVMKRATLLIIIGVLVFVSAFTLNVGGIEVGATFFYANKRHPIYAVQTDEQKLSISFDAAWGAEKTSEIISLCKQYNIKATFFLVSFWVEEYPERVLEIYNNGFEIGLHSTTHPDMTKLTKKEMINELETNIKAIEKITGVKPKLFRPPFGYYNNNLLEVCDSLGITCVQWSVDSLDWKGISANELSERVIKNSKNGSIVLFHNNSDNIIPGLKLVLEYYKNKGIQVVPIGKLIYKDNYTINNQGIQIKN